MNKRKYSSIVDFDVPGDGKNLNCGINIVNKNFLDEESMSSSASKSSQSSIFQREIQPRKSLLSEKLQTISPGEQKENEFNIEN